MTKATKAKKINVNGRAEKQCSKNNRKKLTTLVNTYSKKVVDLQDGWYVVPKTDYICTIYHHDTVYFDKIIPNLWKLIKSCKKIYRVSAYSISRDCSMLFKSKPVKLDAWFAGDNVTFGINLPNDIPKDSMLVLAQTND